MEKKRIPLKILKNEFGGRRPAGRPRNRWLDAVERDIKQLLGLRIWRRAALNRQEWRGLIQECTQTPNTLYL
ncbi:hypothetical protein C0J52_17757 [Blattella germanica]|nr:hypothetical protein C0J52_17757 [Blattella germanica]